MPKKKIKKVEEPVIEAVVTEQGITETLKVNYMPYAMSVIISRAIPEIDGFKPSHRKLLYTMYKMGLLHGNLTKSSNIVGQTMQLNPHGDAAIYETMVRLTKGNEALLHPFIESKGSFGKVYSDMAFAAARYTEAKLDSFCEYIFGGIDKDAVEMVDNFDGTQKEPILLPTAFPNILVSPNKGIAVGMASDFCSFNLGEVCDAVCEYIKNPDVDLLEIIKGPDFTTGGYLLYDKAQLEEIYKTGRGSFKLRCKYSYNKKDNCIEVTEIPYSTKIEAIIDKISSLAKEGKVKEISDVRDETGLNGLRLTIDLKRGADHEKLMKRLLKNTTLEDSFSCNFNVLIAGSPKTLGIGEIIEEWTAWRSECIKRELYFNLQKMKEKLHLLLGLKEILADIDKAIKIIRKTEKDKDVIPNLMKGFDIDEIQAEYIAEIKLRYLNKEYILNRLEETDELENKIADTEDTLKSERKVRGIISKQLGEIKKKYAKPRKTEIIYEFESSIPDEPAILDYPVNVVITKEGYFKKILPPKSDRAKIEEQKLKENDSIIFEQLVANDYDLVAFSDKCQVYKAKLDDFDEVKPSALGDYIPAKLGFESDENVVAMTVTKDYKGSVALFFENGKAVLIPMSCYETKTNRKKLTNAYSNDSRAVGIFFVPQIKTRSDHKDFFLKSDGGKGMIVSSSVLTSKVTRTSNGVICFTIKKGQKLVSATEFVDDGSEERKEILSRYRKTKVPSTGTTITNGKQLSFLI